MSRRAKHPLPVVYPSWIVQSIERKTLLPVRQFLYTGFTDPTQSSLSSLSLSSDSAKSPAGREVGNATFEEKKLPPEQATDENARVSATAPTVPAAPSASTAEQLDGDPNLDEDEEDNEDEAESDEQLEHPRSPSANEDKRSSLLSQGRANSTRDGPARFVRHFFAKSRLHHIGSWRSTFQQRATEFQSKYKGKRITRAPPTSTDRVILHVDMDCFFVAVAVRGRTDLQDVPIAVAHSGNAGSSEISSCNYLARENGLRAGMFMLTAKELCPSLVVLPYNFGAIEKVSFQIYDIFFSHTPYVQAISCDEAFLEFGNATDGMVKARQIREEIFAKTQCAASVGVSFNMLLAKLASKKAKPNGMFQIARPADAQDYMLSLKIRDLPGVGRRLSDKFEELGLEDVKQLTSLSKTNLLRHFGKSSSDKLYKYARGIDERSLSLEANMMRKSVSAVVNFGIRFDKWTDATEFLMALSEELSSRLRNLNFRTKCLTILIKKRRDGQPVESVKYMGHGICDNYTKSHMLSMPTNDPEALCAVCVELLRQLQIPCEDLRGVGIQATKLVSDSHPNSGRERSMKAWLTEQQQRQVKPNESKHESDEETKGERDDTMQTEQRSNFDGHVDASQLDPDVLAALPASICDEVLSTYRRSNLSSTAGGKPAAIFVQAAPRSRTMVYTNQGRHPPAPDSTDALNDIPMSQIDSEVYHALPFTIRKEIDRYAKKRKPSARVPPPPSSSPLSSLAPAPPLSQEAPLPSIETLYANLTQFLDGASNGVDDIEVATELERSAASAFDAIYSRILVEVETRAIDSALRMLRFVRRKCREACAVSPLAAHLLTAGYNNILLQVNSDVQRHFGGALSSRSVGPL